MRSILGPHGHPAWGIPYPTEPKTAQSRAPLVHQHQLGERLAGGREVNLDPVAAQHGKPTLVAAQSNQLPTRRHRISW